MTALEHTARQARRWLWVQRWLTAMCWTLAAAAVVFVVAVAMDRVWLASDESGGFFAYLVLGLLAVSVISAVVWAWLTRGTLTQAAAHLDEAAGLKERVSTGLHCEQSDDPFAQAVAADARRVSQALPVRRLLPLRVPYSANYAGGTLVVALLFFWLFPTLDLAGHQEQRDDERKNRDQIERTQAAIQPVLEKQVQQLGQKYPDLKKELEKLAPLAQADMKRPEDVRNEPIKQINKLNEELKRKQNRLDLAQVEEFKRIAQKVAAQQRNRTPVTELAKAMAKGDFKSAQEALDQLKLALSKAPKTEDEKQKADELRKQLEQMASKLDQLAKNDKKNKQDLEKAGLNADQVKRALEQLQKKDLDAVKKMLAEKG